MNWDAIGAVGEIVGAGAVVATLIYLSVQMRLSRQATEVQSTYSSVERYANWRTHLIQNPELALIVAKANRGEPLQDEEDIQLNALVYDLCITCIVSHAASTRANALYDHSADVDYLVATLRANPGFHPYWRNSTDLLNKVDSNIPIMVNAALAGGEKGHVNN
jgi:hypothetical protein